MKEINDFLQQKLINDSVFVIGSVFSVKGKDIVVKVNKDKNLPHLFFDGEIIKNVSVGLSNYIKILKGFTEIICKVQGEYLEEDKFQTSKEYTSEKQRIERFINVSVFGFYDHNGEFQHGIKEMPLIGSECRLLSREEFENLHQLSKQDKLAIRLGSLIDDEIQEIHIPVRKLFAGHIGIFGNTGSGKSNTLARIYTELFNSKSLNDDFWERSKFIVIDFNGEYSKQDTDHILTENKTVYQLKTQGESEDKYPIVKTEIEKLELISILLDATEKTQQPFLHRAIDNSWFSKDNENYGKEVISIKQSLVRILEATDKNFNVPFLRKFIEDFENLNFQIRNDKYKTDEFKYHNKYSKIYLNRNGDDFYFESHPLEFIGADTSCFKIVVPPKLDDLQHIQFKILNQYYFEILSGHINQEHIGPLMGRLKKRFAMLNKVIEVSERQDGESNIKIVDLKNVNLEMKKVLPMLICKAGYDQQKEEFQKDSTLHIIIDEAHNILSEHSTRESDAWKDYRLETFEEIIKEGRKFGVFLTISSQRPADISPTIISQLHNYFIHRLMNQNDLYSINKAVSYLDKLSFDSISNLSVGCCFIAGQMTQFPLSVKVELLEGNQQPQSETIDLDRLWKI